MWNFDWPLDQEMSQVKFPFVQAVRVLVYSGSAHREPVSPLLIAAAECCWAAALQLTQALSHRATPPLFPTLLPPFLNNLIGILRHSIVWALWKWNLLFQMMMTHLYCWRPFFTLTWTKFLAQTTLAGVGACETIPFGFVRICENGFVRVAAMDLWEHSFCISWLT